MVTVAQHNTRRFTRIGFRLPVRFHDGSGALGEATLSDVSYGGLGVTMGRYLKPKTVVRIPVRAGQRTISFPARVIWCTPEPASESFRAGLQADHGDRHTMAILSSWMLDAFREPASGPDTSGAVP